MAVTKNNILAASANILFGGLFAIFPTLKTGLPAFAVISALFIGLGLSGFYLGAQWDKKGKPQIIIASACALITTVGISLALLSLQGNFSS